MPTFYIINGVKIELYFDDHQPPHFHAIIAEYEAVIDIRRAEIIQGSLPRNKRKEILKWAKEESEELLELWDELKM